MSRFDYITDKVRSAPFTTDPFKHIYIEDLFTAEDFAEITGSPDIDIPAAANDEDLFEKLHSHGYRIIEFPGCVEDKDAYLTWHRERDKDTRTNSACEGFGMTLRLTKPTAPVLKELDAFLASESFNRVVAERFGVEYDACTIDGGIQKYLDGYEISPHPDIRRKAATFMVNINPHSNSEALEHHTHYLRMTPDFEYVRQFWENEEECERAWVPWDWCQTVKTQPRNNSIVLFSPSADTVHGVKAAYDHLAGQRTQLYGNIWYKKSPMLEKVEWEDLQRGPQYLDGVAIAAKKAARARNLKAQAKGVVKTLLGKNKDESSFSRRYF